MITTAQCLARYGDPRLERNMAVFLMPPDLLAHNPSLPKKVYANRDIHHALSAALYKCRDVGVLREIVTFDGCFNIRLMRGGTSSSLHSWGVAVDWNASRNLMGQSVARLLDRGLRPFSERFLQCWRDTGWHCGGDWNTPDRMHFQLAKLP